MELTKIPVIMRAMGWDRAALLLETWFRRSAYIKAEGRATESELNSAFNFGDLNWVISQSYGRETYDKIFNRKLWRSEDENNGRARTRLGDILRRDGLLNERASNTQFGYRNYGAVDYERNRTALNASTFRTGVFTELNHIVAALGSFQLKIALNGRFSHAPMGYLHNRYRIKPESLDIYLWDSFDFIGGQHLGCWNETNNTVGKLPGENRVCVGNGHFAQWRREHRMGGDFYLFTNVLRVPLNSADDSEEFYILTS